MGEGKRRLEQELLNGAAAPPNVDLAKPAVITKPAKRIMIASPIHSGMLDCSANGAFNQMAVEAMQNGWHLARYERLTDSMLPRARDVIVAKFMAEDATDLLMVDGDVWCDPGCFARLMSHPVELVGGVYPHRGDDRELFIFQPLADRLTFDDKTGLMEVRGIATGFLRITRAVIERLTAVHDDDWYMDPTAPDMRIYNFFNFEVKNRLMWGEDYVFSQKWRAIGGKCWIDPELMLHHKGSKVFSGRLGDWLRNRYQQLQMAALTPENRLTRSEMAQRILVHG